MKDLCLKDMQHHIMFHCICLMWIFCLSRLQGGPKKRVVQPRLIGPAAKTSKKGTESGGGPTSEALTAAVAASAAIAATQPFLKVKLSNSAETHNVR